MKLNRSVGRRLGLVVGGIAAAALLVAALEYALRAFDIGAERGLFTAEPGADGRDMLRLSSNPQFNKPVPPILAADPEIRVNELVSRAVVCFAAGRNDCAFEQLAVAKTATTNDTTRQAIERFFQTAPAAAAPKQEAGS